MKTLIAYASKTGATKKCAEYLYNEIKEKQETDLINLKESAPDVSLYDTVVIGSPIRMGKIQRSVKNFMAKYEDILKDKNLYIFFCCSADEFMEKYSNDNIPQSLSDSAKLIVSFGGEVDVQSAKGFDKFVLKMVAKTMKEQSKKVPCILYDNIDMLVQKLDRQ